MKYVTSKTTHTTGEVFFDAKSIKENEGYAIVEAVSVEHAKEIMKNIFECSVCGSYNTRVEDIIMSDTGQKIGETFVCDNCMAGQRNKK